MSERCVVSAALTGVLAGRDLCAAIDIASIFERNATLV